MQNISCSLGDLELSPHNLHLLMLKALELQLLDGNMLHEKAAWAKTVISPHRLALGIRTPCAYGGWTHSWPSSQTIRRLAPPPLRILEEAVTADPQKRHLP